MPYSSIPILRRNHAKKKPSSHLTRKESHPPLSLTLTPLPSDEVEALCLAPSLQSRSKPGPNVYSPQENNKDTKTSMIGSFAFQKCIFRFSLGVQFPCREKAKLSVATPNSVSWATCPLEFETRFFVAKLFHYSPGACKWTYLPISTPFKKRLIKTKHLFNNQIGLQSF